ncbi:Pr6Pr family membrane protein [Streptomyces coacervatus]|uniref:Pr6Pr family membrane protein n=1 Tax=Streptomyces coacervatus TaxID=647381 RepID=A0ABP7HXC1_9ACTN|nr:Pr6Pr family membrane protein [Streptomyces coacervatus]MDF2270674.1 Pr6Pr family membrane protein [Streptomyces coacervatus]
MTAPIPRDIPDLPAVPTVPTVPGMPGLLPSPVPASAVLAPIHRPLTAAYRLLVALAAVAGVTIDLLLGSPVRVLSYFTIQSSILLALVFALGARRAWTARHPLPSALTGATLLYITITGLVYHLLLAGASTPFSMTGGTTPPTGWQWISNQLLHTAVPVAALLDWLILTTPCRLHLRQAPTWLLYPLAYLVFSLVRGELILPGTPGRYLYPFLDADLHSYKNVLGNALLLGLAFYALAVVMIAVDHARPNPVRHRPHHRAKTGFRLQPPVG